jgi:sec-independent protein translocase protein TatA
MGPLGVPELIIIFVVALVVFGPRKLPELGRSLGKSLSEFKRASSELRSTLDEEIQAEDRRATMAKTSAVPAAATSSSSQTDYGAPDDADYPDSDPQDDYRVGAAEANPPADEATPASTPAPSPLPETVARGQHG